MRRLRMIFLPLAVSMMALTACSSSPTTPNADPAPNTSAPTSTETQEDLPVGCPAIAAANSINLRITGVDQDLINADGKDVRRFQTYIELCDGEDCEKHNEYLMQNTENVETSDPDGNYVSVEVVPVDDGTLLGWVYLPHDVEAKEFALSMDVVFPGKLVTTGPHAVQVNEVDQGTEMCPLPAKVGELELEWDDFTEE